MITFLGLEYMVDATQDLRLGSGGVGCGLEHMVDATQHSKAGVGWGGVG